MKYPASKQWAETQVLSCPDRKHAWRRWAGEPPTAWVPEADWDLRAAYQYAPRSKLRADLLEMIREIGVRPLHRSDDFNEVVQWAMNDLPTAAPHHPLTPKAVAVATFWWRYR